MSIIYRFTIEIRSGGAVVSGFYAHARTMCSRELPATRPHLLNNFTTLTLTFPLKTTINFEICLVVGPIVSALSKMVKMCNVLINARHAMDGAI